MKFMLSVREDQGKDLARLANKRRVTIQELIRAVIIPEWKEMNGNARKGPESKIAHADSPPAINPVTNSGPLDTPEKKAKQE